MKIYLFHGDDFIKLENEYANFLNDLNEYNKIYLKDEINMENSFDSLLFPEKRLFIIESIKYITDKVIEKINKDNDTKNILVIYYIGSLRKDLINKFKTKVIERKYMLPKEIFRFLDILFLKKGKVFIDSYKKVKELYPQELILHFIFSHLKDMLLELNKVSVVPAWKKYTINNQLGKVDKLKLKSLLQELALLDYQMKTGISDPLVLDLYVYKNLE